MVNFCKTIEEMRSRSPVTREWAYLEIASTGLIPDFVYDGIRRYMDDRYYKGGDSIWEYPDASVGTLGMWDRSKAAIAEMINGDPACIAFGTSSTQMFTMVTEGIEYGPADNVVALQGCWYGNRFAWQKRESEGLEVRYAYPVDGEVRLSEIAKLVDENTRAVTVNLVESGTGFRVDIDEIGAFCKERDILLFVDGVQALGVLDVDVKRSGIDFMVGNDYKWMMNFCGCGYAYISPRVNKLITRWGAGHMSDTERFNSAKPYLEQRDDAGRFEIGYPNAAGIYGLGLVAMQYNLLGRKAIEDYTTGLAAYFRQKARAAAGVRLTYDFEEKNCSQIVSVKVSPEITITDEDFEKAKVFIHFRGTDENGEREIRVAFHYFNNREDIDRFFAVLAK